MPDPIPDLRGLLHRLQTSQDAQRQLIAAGALDPRLVILRAWQAERLSRTYADLTASPDFAPASRFFLNDIYAPRDFSQRDHDAERLHSFLARLLPAPTIQAFTELVELNRLTSALDAALLRVLFEELQARDSITEEAYAEGYRRCDNYEERKRQIDLIRGLLIQIGIIARMWGTGAVLSAARIPVHKAGWGELFDLVQRGYNAFKPMRNYRFFADTVAARETRILDRIYQGQPHPFET